MELQQYLQILRAYWRSALATLFVCVALVAAYTLLQHPTYTASSTVFITVESGGTAGELSQGATYAERQVKSFVGVATTAIVLQPVIDEMRLDTTPHKLARDLQVSSPANTSIIKIDATSKSPEHAATLSNAVAKSLVDAVEELSPPSTDGVGLVSATIIDQALTPTSPTAPRPAQNLALGVLLGLLLGAGQAILRSTLDTRIRTSEDLEQITAAPVLAEVGRVERTAERPDDVAELNWRNAEAYRRLRTNVGFVGLGGERRSSIVVTSALAGEGKTEITTNLAKVLAQAGESVLLIDADLRRPEAANRLGLDGEVGLSDVLTSRASLQDATILAAPNLAVLPAGTVPPNPSELLGSEAMANLLERVEEQYDYVLFDSPPLLPVTDAVVLAAQTGGAILVTQSGTVKRQQLEAAIGILEAGDVTLLGLVLKDVPIDTRHHYYSAYYSSHPAEKPAPAAKPGRRAQVGV